MGGGEFTRGGHGVISRAERQVAGKAERRNRLALAGLRMFMGLFFLSVWVQNLGKGLYGSEYVPFIQSRAASSSLPVYADFLRQVVVPHEAVFRISQMILEGAVMGLFLLIGFLTPVSAVVAMGFSINLLLASVGAPNDWYGTYLLMLAILLVVAVTRAGRPAGVDSWLADRNPQPRVPLY